MKKQTGRRQRVAALLAVVGLLVMSSGLVLMGTAGSASAGKDHSPKIHKYYVCKYVGKPGVDERLKAGKNPIEVGMQATDGTWFNDAQGRSFVLWAVGDPNHPVPTRSDCPAPDHKPKLATASVDTVQPTCDAPNGSWTASATNATVDGPSSGDGVRNSSVTVNFTANDGAAFAGGSSTNSITVDFGDVVPPAGFVFNPQTGKCEAVSGPVIATASVDTVQPSCDDPNGAWTASATNATVVGKASGDGVRNGTVTVSFKADTGAEFTGGSTTKSITVQFGDVVPPTGQTFDPVTGLCVAVSPPTVTPTPTPTTPSGPSTQVSAPQVSAPSTSTSSPSQTTTVPSTVEAGLAGTDQGSSREPGLVLTAVGALLLAAAGSLAATRRKVGAHV